MTQQQHEAEARRALIGLRSFAETMGLAVTKTAIIERPRAWLWPFGKRLATIRIWQHGAGNKLFVKRHVDCDDLRLVLGYANLTGWEINE